MTALRRRGLRGLLTAAWWGSALTTVFALIGLLVITGAPGPARPALRADTYNQMTGVGSTASAVTVNWSNGLLDSSNQPISGSSSTDGGPELNPNADRAAGTGSLFFMDSDFKNLQVTVSQTQNIGQQGVTVSWTGGGPTGDPSTQQTNYLQMMECYGDSAGGPSPEGCLFGADPFQAPAAYPSDATDRGGYLCGTGGLGSVQPSTTNPPADVTGSALNGCDPFEPAAETPAHCDPTAGAPASDTCPGGRSYIPFVPVDDSGNPVYENTNIVQTFKTTNEVPFALTNADGTGQRQFQTFTANQAPSLGCGAAESNGQTRNCWLVIVPRGTYEPNGYQANSPQGSSPWAGNSISTSPLSAANWAQRIQVHLDYAPLAVNCPPTALPQGMVGTQVVSRAVTSWEQALNQQAHCSTIYSYAASTESANTSQLTGAASGIPGSAGLAFTTVPIGSEATREGGPASALPKNILYAPVAVTAIDFGFNINEKNNKPSGQDTTPVKLTPALVARSLTQVYRSDMPDYTIEPSKQPAGQTWWAQNNPINITQDPEFVKLNPAATNPGESQFNSFAPLFTGDHSGDNQLVWDYIQSDPATASWLDGGAPDPSDPVAADPYYVSLPAQPGKSPAPDSYPVAYTPTVTCPQVYAEQCPSTYDTALDSVAMLAVQNNFDQAASSVLSAVDPALGPSWDPGNTSQDHLQGWWGSPGPEAVGNVFMWAVNDMPDLAAYGIVSAALCDVSGANCVQPSVASVSAALNSATTTAGLLQVNPAKVPAGAYPLVDVVYAAVPTDQPAAALTNYANFIAYAANQGQAAGTNQGNLPAGYLPLTPALQTQANSVVTQLQADAAASPSPSTSPTTSPTQGTTTGNTTANTTGSTTPAGGSTTPAGTTPAGTSPGGTTPGGTVPGGVNSKPGGGGAAPAGKHTAPTGTSKPGSTGTHPTGAPTVPFDVIQPTAQADAGTTQGNPVGAVRVVLIVVLIIGAAGAVAGGLLRYGHIPERFRRHPLKADTS